MSDEHGCPPVLTPEEGELLCFYFVYLHRTGTAGGRIGTFSDFSELFCFYIVCLHRTGTALSDDNGRTLVTTAPWAGPGGRGRETA
jgi:hypothetical protein